MLGLRVTMPFGSWRVEYARQYRQTYPVPPPATAYGMLLSLVGETNVKKYLGAAVTCGVVSLSELSTILRKIRRHGGSTKPDAEFFDLTLDTQEIYTDVDLVVWVDHPEFEARIRRAISNPEEVTRFGGLSCGESSFLVDSLKVIRDGECPVARTFVLSSEGELSLPLVPDYDSNLRAICATGDLVQMDRPPSLELMPVIIC